MDPELWHRVEELFRRALELDESRRAEFLQRACAGDEPLRREVESLLAQEKKKEHFIDSPALDVVGKLVANEAGKGSEVKLIGTTVSHYRVLEKLGGGGMGVVYKAEDIRLGRRVALKFLPEALARDSRTLQRFEREARAASSLNHPSICTIYEVEEYDRQPVIVMELLEGKSLKQRISEGPLATSELLDFGIQTADALEAAHAKGIIHRDIKPANLFVLTSGRIKVLDFGLAKVMPSHLAENEVDEESLTAEGVIPGTTAYMSPEQIRGAEIDARSDLFSLGVVLYEIAAGKRPFVGKNRVLVMDAILNAKPVVPSRENPALPAGLDAIIIKTLEKDRSVRYQHASEIAVDLKLLRGGAAIAEPSPFAPPAGVAVGATSRRAEGQGKMRPPYLVTLRRKGADAAVIFIHGFSGHPRETWGAFPDALAAHLAPAEWDLFSLGYASRLSLDLVGIWTADPDLNLLATYLHTALDQPPLDRYKQLTLIAHSMGGLVVQRALLDHDDMLARARHVFLFATPSAGLTKASWVGRFKRQWRDLRPDSSFIRSLRTDWEQKFAAMPPFDLVSIAGDRDEFVPAASCFSPFPAACCAVVPGNHLEVVKPASASELNVQLVLKHLTGGAAPLARSPVDASKPLSHPTLARPMPEPARRGRLGTLLAIAVVVAILIVGYQSRSHRSGPAPSQEVLTNKDTIVLADFSNTTGDSVFDGTLRQGLAVQLEQSPFLSLISEERIQQVLRLMGKPADARLAPDIAREICQRTASAAVLDGSIASLGSQYVLGLHAEDCRTGDVLAEEQVQAARKEDVLNALSQIASKFRSRVGESLTTVKKYDIPLAEATTPSLEALKAYSAGWQVSYSSGSAAAVPFLKRAIEIDPNFASAYAALGRLYGDIGESALSAQNTSKAYQLRNRASDQEKFFISLMYDLQVTGNLEKAQQTCDLWMQAYPRAWFPHALLSGGVYTSLGKYEKSVEEAKLALGIDPDFSIGYSLLAASYLALDRTDEAEKALQQAFERKLDIPDFHVQRYVIDFLKDDKPGMEREATQSRERPGLDDWMSNAEGFVSACSGHLEEARKMSRRAADFAREAEKRDTEALYEADAAVREALFGNASTARQRAVDALELSRVRDVEYEAALALALSGDSSRSQALTDDLYRRFPEDTMLQFTYVPTLRALDALNHGQPSKTVELLQTAIPYEGGDPIEGGSEFLLGAISFYPAYVRGLAYLAAHQGAEAAGEFQKILGHRGIVSTNPIGALAHLQLGRAYALSGDKTIAKSAYQGFFTLWKDADPDIPIFQQAKAEYAKLQ